MDPALACSFCLSIPPPGWWSSPVPLPVVLLALVGVVVAYLALTRARGALRVGALLLALGFAGALPLAAWSVRAGRTSVDVVAERRPSDADAWRVTCEAAVQVPGDDEFVLACNEATAAWRGTALGLAAASAVLVVGGFAVVLVSSRQRDRAPA